jgi:hypothetical protein
MRNKRVIYLLALFVWPFAASLFVLWSGPPLIIAGLVFYGMPAMALALTLPKVVGRVLMFSALTIATIAIPFEYIAEITRTYVIRDSVFGTARLFDVVTIDVLLWGILWLFATIMFYEVFSNRSRTARIPWRHLRWAFLVSGGFFSVFLLLYFLNREALVISDWYLKFLTVFMLGPFGYMLWRYPKIRTPFYLTSVYFFIVNLAHEVTSLRIGHWYFADSEQVLGSLRVLGQSFPYDELLLYIIFMTPVTLAYYEVFDDNRR